MWNHLLTLAREFRRRFYELSSANIFGVEVDIILHIVVGAVIFAAVDRRWGSRAAFWTLAICIVAKEMIDLFAKSSTEYVQMPTAAGKTDIIMDILFSVIGGFVVWAWRRRNTSRG